MRILVVSPLLPQPQPSNAVGLVVYAQLIGLIAHHELTLVTSAGPDPGDRELVQKLRLLGVRVHVVWRQNPHGLQRWKRRWRFVAMWMSGKYPFRTIWFWEPALQHLLDTITAHNAFDMIHVQDNAAGLYRFETAVPILMTEHEARTARSIDRLPEANARRFQQIWHYAERRRWLHYEPSVWRRFSGIHVFTRRDATSVTSMAPDLADRIWVAPFGIELPVPANPDRERAGEIVFVGGYSHPPNVDAALWLVREIMPLLRTCCPGVTLTLVGSDPPEAVHALACDDVTVTGRVPAVEPYLERASVVVAPIRIGGGMRMKVLQAMAMSKAVVTTPLGAEGLAIKDQQPPLVIAEDAYGFATAVCQLLASSDARGSLGKAARSFVEQYHSALAYAQRLEAIYQELRQSRYTHEAGNMSVAIVNYNTREDLRACLDTIEPESPESVVVVDNASSDGSVEMVRASYPWVTVQQNSTNRGFGAAANQALALCQSDYILLLNSDTRLRKGALQALGSYLAMHSQAAIVGPRLLNSDGTLQISCFPFETPLHLLLRESALDSWIRHLPVLRNHYLPAWAHDRPRVVPWVMGAALAIRRAAFDQVGGFDESFFMYSEEVDLCYRLRDAGWQVHFAPVTNVTHIRYASTNQQPADMMVWLFRSRVHFYRRHYSRLRLLLFKGVVAYIGLRSLALGVMRLRRTRQSSVRALLLEDMATQKRVLAAVLREA